jgi:hypothetical protein
MSDSTEKKPFEGKFFTFIRPFLAFVDSPRYFTKPFSWLYLLFAVVFLLVPFGLLFVMIGGGFFKSSGNIIFGGILTLIAVFIASWLAFQIWLNRRRVIQVEKVTVAVIIDALAKLLRTGIEANSVFMGVAGFCAGLFTFLFAGELLSLVGLSSALALPLMVGSLLGGYFGIWFAKLVEFLFPKIANIVVYVTVRIFNFIVHIIKQLFEYFFIFWQSIVDFIVNGWKVVIALVVKLGNTLLAVAHAPINSNKANITYND